MTTIECLACGLKFQDKSYPVALAEWRKHQAAEHPDIGEEA